VNCFFALSLRASDPVGAAALARAVDTLSALCGQEPVRLGSGTEVVLATGCDIHDEGPDGGLAAVGAVGTPAVGFLAAVRASGDAAFRGPAAPFAAVVRAQPGPLLVGVDHCGLYPVAWCQGPGWAAASTSALAVARVLGAGFDETALGVWAHVGHHLGNHTGFSGVRILPPGGTLRLEAGAARATPAPRPPLEPRDPARVALDRGVEAVRTAVGVALDAADDAGIELSGGLDSRLLLAAVPPERRRGMLAVTIDSPGSRDAQIARVLARRFGFDHLVVDRRGLARLDPPTAEDLARAAVRRRDLSGNALAQAGIDWVEAQLPQGPRLTGQNGEFARGVYYRALPIRVLEHVRSGAAATRPLDDLVARLRFLTNQRVDPSVFAPGFVDSALAATRTRIREVFERCEGDWASASDELYLDTRMRRWAGAELSTAAAQRRVLAPFFHPEYLRWSRTAAPHDKRHGALFARVLTRLDPFLASVPLDRGNLTPAALASSSARLRTARDITRRAATKLAQRVGRTHRAPAGASDLGPRIQAAWNGHGEALGALAGLPFLDARTVEVAASGAAGFDPATVGFLLSLDEATSFLRRR
jgi:asparagine synthase (glutamine-hydrolysing)